MRFVLHLFYLPLIVCNHGIIASDTHDKSTRSIDANSKYSDQPFRVNLTCKSQSINVENIPMWNRRSLCRFACYGRFCHFRMHDVLVRVSSYMCPPLSLSLFLGTMLIFAIGGLHLWIDAKSSRILVMWLIVLQMHFMASVDWTERIQSYLLCAHAHIVFAVRIASHRISSACVHKS